MYHCIKSFNESDRENGLLLLDMPTGFGKTYSVIKYIVDFMTDENNSDKKVFFITTLKKNLPYDELEQCLVELGLSQIFEERVIKLEPNADTAKKYYSSEMLKDIPDEIRRSDEFKNFKADVEFLQNAEKGQNKEFIQSVVNNYKNNTEPAFRKFLKAILFKEFSTVEKRLFAIKTDSAWQWVGKLYPSVFTREKQVLFMSMDKFICPHSTIIEKTYTFYNSSIINGALVFIDEFDATKETILKNIIENGLSEKIDYIELFNHIYAVLQNKTFPEELFNPSEKRRGGEYSKQSLKDVLKDLKEKADNIFNTHSLQFNHKTDSTEQETNNFLFNDHRYISILNGQNRFVSTYTDKNESINKIIFSADKPADKKSIQSLLEKMRGFVSWFQTAVRIFAANYYQVRCENLKDGEEEYSFESAIRSVLTEFNLGSVYENYLFTQILMMRGKSKNSNADSKYDLSFYEKGFRYFSFENSPDYEFKSIISMISFSQTPERFLTRLCEKAKVIGVSATATLPSVLCNYDLRYFKVKMGADYTISDEDYNRLKIEFDKAQNGYKDISIHAELFDSSNYSVEIWNRIYDNVELSNAAKTLVDNALSGEQIKNTFFHERYFKIALAFKQFISHTDIRSFLCVLNKHPKSGDKYLDIDVLYKLFALIAEDTVDTVKQMVVLLDGNGFDDKKLQLSARLANGEKLFVISAYQTTGAGQNLQYDIPADLVGTLIKINERASSSQKDFDAIYLDRPTNLTVNMNSNSIIEDKEFVKYIFETEYLQENGEISQDVAKQNIKKAFERCFCGKTFYDACYSKTPSVCYYATKQIVQAIGRICRTNAKQPTIYVFADAKICDFFQVGIAEKRMLNREVAALIEEIIKHGAVEIPEPDLRGRGELCSNRVNRFINGMLREEWDDSGMKLWEDLRNLVLSKPTATEADVLSDFRLSQFYIELSTPSDKYYYSQDEDYNKTKISFVPSRTFPCEVSATCAKLNRILLFSGMKELFCKNGWATTFSPNKFNMSAALFNNIYKGALGEKAGSFWFKNVLNIELEEIKEPALFELFDYKVSELPVYVDFKNWHETTHFDEEETINKVIVKAKECKAECVIVANILAENAYSTKVTRIDGITLVCCPSLMIDNNSSVDVNIEAAKTIRRCINEIGNSH